MGICVVKQDFFVMTPKKCVLVINFKGLCMCICLYIRCFFFVNAAESSFAKLLLKNMF